METTKVIRNDWGSPSVEQLVPPGVKVDFTSTSYGTFGLGIKGFWLSGCLRGRQKETGSGGRSFWRTVQRVQKHEGVKGYDLVQ